MSTHKSYRAPKRGSKSYTVTRDDMMLATEGGQWRRGLEVTPILCGAGGTKKFRLQLTDSTDNICGLDSLADELRTASNLHVSVVENVMNVLLEVIPRYIAKTGCAVRLGNLLTLKPCVTGTLDSSVDEPDPKKNHVEIRATVSPALRYSLSRIKLVNVNRRKGLGKVIREMNNAKADEVDAEHNILVNGHCIYVPPQSATDENTRGSVWIETLNGERLGRCAVLESGPDLLTVRFIPDKPVGECEAKIFVETYGTKEAVETGDKSGFARYTRTVRVVVDKNTAKEPGT